MGGGVAAAAQGRHDAEAALQAAQKELAEMKLERQPQQQLAAAAPAAPAPAVSPAGCGPLQPCSERPPRMCVMVLRGRLERVLGLQGDCCALAACHGLGQ